MSQAPAPCEWISALAGYITDDASTATVAGHGAVFGYYFHGGYYPQGGSGAMADSLERAIEQRGGRVHLRTPVVKITTADGAATGLLVQDIHGRQRRIAAKAVVCNADAREAVTRLLDDPSVAGRWKRRSGRCSRRALPSASRSACAGRWICRPWCIW